MGYDEEALFRLSQCYFQTRMFDNAKATVQQLLTQYPETDYKGSAQALLEKLGKKKSD